MKSVELGSVVSRAKNPSSVELNGDLIMMDLKRENYLGLNPVAASIWAVTESTQTVASICELMQQEYSVDKTTCETDVCACIEEMCELGLVSIN